MNDEQYCCEYCGHYSFNKDICTHCGRDISDMTSKPALFSQPIAGKLTVRVYDTARAAEAWKELAELWDSLERNTNLGLQRSQMEKFPPPGDVLELYGRDLEALIIQDKLPGQFTIEFQEVHWSEVPRRPMRPPPRPPRGKR